MISWSLAERGQRLTAASMLPRSLRQGMTMLADKLGGPFRRQRARDHIVRRHSRRMPGSGARYLLIRCPSPSSRRGTSWRQSHLDRFELGEIENVQEVGGIEVVGRRLRHFQPDPLRDFEERLPELRVIGDDDAGLRTADRMQLAQSGLDVVKHADGVGQDDIIERTFERTDEGFVLDVPDEKSVVGIKPFRLVDHGGAEIDAYAIGGFEFQPADRRYHSRGRARARLSAPGTSCNCGRRDRRNGCARSIAGGRARSCWHAPGSWPFAHRRAARKSQLEPADSRLRSLSQWQRAAAELDHQRHRTAAKTNSRHQQPVGDR